MAAPKKPRKPTFSDPIVRKEHDRIRREQATRKARHAAQSLDEARQTLYRIPVDPTIRALAQRRNSVITGLLPRVKAVMSSYGLQLPVMAKPDKQAGGWTDFKTINITFDQRLVSQAVNDVVDTSTLRMLAGETRGVFYHELGHNRFTTPLLDLHAQALVEGFDPGHDVARLKNAWNILEDQRMESAVVIDSPHIASYLTVLVLRLIAKPELIGENFPLLVGRWYLPDEVLQASEAAFGRDLTGPSGVTAAQVRDCVAAYCAATTARDMFEQVAIFYGLLSDMNMGSKGNQFDNHGSGLTGEYIHPDDLQPGDIIIKGDSILGDQHKPSKPSKGKGDNPSKDDAGDAQGDSGAAGDKSDKDAQTGAGDTTDQDAQPDYEDDRKALQDALDKCLDEWANDSTLTRDIRAMNESLENAATLPYYRHITVSDDAQRISQAHNLQHRMVETFKVANADATPTWQSQQRAGVLEPLRYRTRQPGEMEFFRTYSDHGDPGTDLEVSVLLDVSMSMAGTGTALGAAAWAIKSAGDELRIPTSVGVFNTEGFMVWNADDRPDFVPNIGDNGGTDPSSLLVGMLSGESSAKHHIVLIMTDGDWSPEGDANLRRYLRPNRTVVLFEYGSQNAYLDADAKRQHLQGLMLNYGPDQAHVIDNLFAIPQALENILATTGRN